MSERIFNTKKIFDNVFSCIILGKTRYRSITRGLPKNVFSLDEPYLMTLRSKIGVVHCGLKVIHIQYVIVFYDAPNGTHGI